MKYTLLFKIKDKNLFSVISNSVQHLITFNKELEQLDYSPETLLDNNQCYKIKNFSNQDYCPDFLKKEFATGDYDQWQKEHQNIEYSLNTNRLEFYFQKFTKSQLLRKSWLSISDEPELKRTNIITFNPYATAYYNKTKNVLLFKKLDDLKNIFPGIEELYREATQDEVDKFLKSNLFNTESYDVNNLGIANRKRIALILDTDKVKNFDKRYLREYIPHIKIKDGAVVIEKEADLKNVLYAIDERFYTTNISKEQRLANSVIALSKND